MDRYVRVVIGIAAFAGGLIAVWYGAADASRSSAWSEVEHAASQSYGPDHVASLGVQPLAASDRHEAIAVLADSTALQQLPAELRRALRHDAATGFRPLIIEGHQRGVTFTVPLTSTVQASGPWTKVDKEALLAKLADGAPAGSVARSMSDFHSHDEYDTLVSQGSLSADDYRTTSFSSPAAVDAIEVAIDLSSGTVLRLGPLNTPALAGSPVEASGPAPRDYSWAERYKPPRPAGAAEATGTEPEVGR